MTRDKNAVILSLKRNKNLVKWSLNNGYVLHDEESEMLEKFLTYADLRLGLLEKKKLCNFFRLFSYRQFYRTFKQELGDFYLATMK